MGDKGVSDVVRPPEGGQAEDRGIVISSLPRSIDRPARMPNSPLKKPLHKAEIFQNMICDEHLTRQTSMAQVLFYVGQGTGSVSLTLPSTPKISRASSTVS